MFFSSVGTTYFTQWLHIGLLLVVSSFTEAFQAKDWFTIATLAMIVAKICVWSFSIMILTYYRMPAAPRAVVNMGIAVTVSTDLPWIVLAVLSGEYVEPVIWVSVWFSMAHIGWSLCCVPVFYNTGRGMFNDPSGTMGTSDLPAAHGTEEPASRIEVGVSVKKEKIRKIRKHWKIVEIIIKIINF